jgi:(4S)-4-hydroxy-5-phosphonooxypentane-2,3-dione isomerase
MFVMIVQIHVKPAFIEQFRKATLENARASLLEPSIQRFDFLQQSDDPDRFILYEVYDSEVGIAAHRTTIHYKVWKETVEGMLAEPRQRIVCESIFPEKEGWTKA